MAPLGPNVLSGVGRFAAAWLCLPFVTAAMSGPAHAACQLEQDAEFQVVNGRGPPVVRGKIDGKDVFFAIDTGDSITSLEMAAAERLGLPLVSGPAGLHMYGVGGEVQVRETTVDLELGGFKLPGKKMLVIGQSQHGVGVAGLMGWDLLQHWDVEFDLADHAIRLFKPKDCKGDEVVYWSSAYSKAPLQLGSTYAPKVLVDVLLNGRKVQATIDSGATVSIVTRAAAGRGGVTPSAKADGKTFGLGPTVIPVSTAVFDTFSVGGEEIQNARIKVADMFSKDLVTPTGSNLSRQVEDLPLMLLGADFLRSHRVLIATDQSTLYFTYNGGPVFDLSPPQVAPPPAPQTKDK